MALNDNELFASAAGIGAQIRLVPSKLKVGTLAALSSEALLPKGTPLAWKDSAEKWTVLTQPSDPASYTITSDGTPASAGTFSIVVNGLAVVLGFDDTAAEVQASLRAALGAAGVEYAAEITAAATAETDLGDAAAVVTVAFPEEMGAPDVRLDAGGLTGNAHVLAAVDAGTALDGTDKIRGFVYDTDGVQTDDTNEVQAIVMLAGDLHRDDINTAAIRAVLGGSITEAELDAALRGKQLRELGLHVQGLDKVA